MANPEEKENPTPRPSYDDFWGDDARPSPVKVEAQCTIALPDRFVRGPMDRACTRKASNDVAPTPQKFCQDALLAWYERYRERKARASRERRAEILELVPTPAQDEPMSRIHVDVKGAIKAEAFGRVLATRFRPTPQGRSMAMREAILEAMVEARSG